MSQTIEAHQLTLRQAHQYLKLQVTFAPDITQALSLTALPQPEELHKLRRLAESYYLEGGLREGQVKLLLVSPLLWLAGFYIPQITIVLEERIAEITLDDQDTVIRGRLDILALHRASSEPDFWIVLIETKNASIDTAAGLPQLLTYAVTGLDKQKSVWGLVTNGIDYQFVRLQAGQRPSYDLFPKLSLLYDRQAEQILQVLRAIARKLP
ncbi:MAG: restriction endonuclease subunit R [Spirulinaceae cyanobacterium]